MVSYLDDMVMMMNTGDKRLDELNKEFISEQIVNKLNAANIKPDKKKIDKFLDKLRY